uniref:Small ribosomal subunit protein bS18c n=1 Tax=Pharnaceum aurantium TaxID=2518628 RepID=A0A411L8Y7_9CARY|nr:ribosomal protein S18 [Pharnaceum aurantium]
MKYKRFPPNPGKPDKPFRYRKRRKKRKSKGPRPPWPPVIRSRDRIAFDNMSLILQFVSDHGKILARRVTKIKLKQQRLMTSAIKQARFFGYLPFRSTERFFKMKLKTRKKQRVSKSKKPTRTFKKKRHFTGRKMARTPA